MIIDGIAIVVSHPDKVLFPDAGITKAALAAYYGRIAAYMLPHIEHRPLTLKRYPHGIGKEGFFNKHVPDHFPDFITRLNVPMRSDSGEARMACADKAADLVYFAAQDVIELHMGLSKAGRLEKPDQIIFDLDPSDDRFDRVRLVALSLKAILDDYGLPAFLKTTGSKGVHVHVPVAPDRNFAELKPFAKEVAQALRERHPDLTTLAQRKDKREAKIFIDYLRNDYAMTAIAPYSPRALRSAPVATPIDWYELKARSINPRSYTVNNIFRRLAQKDDPWKHFATR